MENAHLEQAEKQKQELIEKITTNPNFSHGVFGRFDFDETGGHLLHQPKGSNKLVKELFRSEVIYEIAFGKMMSGAEFKARILKGQVDQGESVFVVSFNDRQGDKRPGSHTDYTLVIPKSEVDNVTPFIEADPSILIDVFRKVYPKYDRSEGNLAIDSERSDIIPIPPSLLIHNPK